MEYFSIKSLSIALVATVTSLITVETYALSIEIDPWRKSWHNSDSGIVDLWKDEKNTIHLLGKDRESIFKAVCMDAQSYRQATCIGDGFNHVRGFRFQYRSSMKYQSDKGLLEEEWEIMDAMGSIKRQGKTTYK